MREGIDEYTLLCEDCGYVIEGLPREGNCPECGKAVAQSLPERRDRVPTIRECLLHPVRCFDRLKMTHNKASARIRRCGFAGLAGCITIMLYTLVANIYYGGMSLGGLFVPLILLGPPIMLFCVVGFELLSLIESRGLRLIGKSRGFRITPAISQSVTTAGSAWWIVSGIGLGLSVDPVMSSLGAARPSPPFWTTGRIILLSTSAFLFCFGFLMFETMAYIGVRRCRFANRQRPPLADEQNEPRP